MPGRTRANGEGSIFPYRNGFAAYVWVTKPDGKRTRKYVYGQTRELVHDKWIKLHQQAKAGRVVTRVPTLGGYLDSWLRDVVEPNLAPATAANYDMFVQLYIAPELGARRLDKLTVREVQTWLNQLRAACQCCLQGKDAARPEGKRKCCAAGRCCQRTISERDRPRRLDYPAGRIEQRCPRRAADPQPGGAAPGREAAPAQDPAVVR